MRLIVDYRPALRARTGVGEWVHHLMQALLRARGREATDRRLALTLFASSWKDRPSADARKALAGATFADCRVPVQVLTWLWNRTGLPPVEWLARGTFDVALSPTPLALPSRAPVRVLTVHDLDFLDHPERTWGEMQRDYPSLVQTHVRRATLVLTPSRFTAEAVVQRLAVAPERVFVCPPGVPDWIREAGAADARTGGMRPAGLTNWPERYVLFVGTLEGRKNVVGLIDAYGLLRARWPSAPPLVLAGAVPPAEADTIRAAVARIGPTHVRLLGYLDPADRLDVYRRASVLVLPSFMEGFGLPALEAMALGVPVVASTRGALPDVVGDAGLLVDPDDHASLATAIERLLTTPQLAAACRAQGLERARTFDWDTSAAALLARLRAELPDRRVA